MVQVLFSLVDGPNIKFTWTQALEHVLVPELIALDTDEVFQVEDKQGRSPLVFLPQAFGRLGNIYSSTPERSWDFLSHSVEIALDSLSKTPSPENSRKTSGSATSMKTWLRIIFQCGMEQVLGRITLYCIAM